MANPTPNEVSSKAAPKNAEATAPDALFAATSTTTTTTTPTSTTTVAPQDAQTAKSEETEQADAYRVLKAFTLDDGMTVMPGEKFVPGDVAKWPARRSKQLVEQKYLRPIK